MDFHSLLKSIVPTTESILEMVDEYSLYCYYSGIEDLKLNHTYPAPFRNDPIPSFVVFRSTRSTMVEYMWKDHGRRESGDIFGLVKKMCQLGSTQEALARISQDFGLGYDTPLIKDSKIVLYNKPTENKVKIRVAARPFSLSGMSFWNQFGIDQSLLDLYNVEQIKWYWSYEGQPTPYWVPDPTFSYRVGQYYQIYSPFAPKTDKFRNDLPENYFFGYIQLPSTGKKLIIDKSSKDVIFCKRLGYDAVCGKSETTFIPVNKMLELKERFEEIYLMLDNDDAGVRMTKKYLELYPWLMPRFLPTEVAKDKTDACKIIGIDATSTLIKDLLVAT